MSTQISGEVDWLYPTTLLNDGMSYKAIIDSINWSHNPLTYLTNTKFKIVYKCGNKRHGWGDHWVKEMLSVGDIVTLISSSSDISGVRCEPPDSYRSYGYPLFSIVPLGQGIVYGDHISKEAYSFLKLNFSKTKIVVAYRYEVDTDNVSFMFDDNSTTNFLVHEMNESMAMASAEFKQTGLKVNGSVTVITEHAVNALYKRVD